MRNKFLYRIYGLTVGANRPIPGLMAVPEGTPIDVHVDLFGSEPEPMAPGSAEVWRANPKRCLRDESWFKLWVVDGDDSGYVRLRYIYDNAYTDFVINPTGSRVWMIRSRPGLANMENVASVLVRRVLGCVLRVRGITCLHASVVAVEHRAIAILGHSGTGKSTTAAGLVKGGYPMLSDDIAALADDETGFRIQPAFPRLALYPTVVNTLYGSAELLPRILWNSEKRYLDLRVVGSSSAWRFQQEPLPLAAIYVLSGSHPQSTVPFIESVGPSEGLMTLLSHGYVSYVLDRAGQGREFDLSGRLAASVPIRRVHRPKGLEYLPQVCDVIVEDARRLMER